MHRRAEPNISYIDWLRQQIARQQGSSMDRADNSYALGLALLNKWRSNPSAPTGKRELMEAISQLRVACTMLADGSDSKTKQYQKTLAAAALALVTMHIKTTPSADIDQLYSALVGRYPDISVGKQAHAEWAQVYIERGMSANHRAICAELYKREEVEEEGEAEDLPERIEQEVVTNFYTAYQKLEQGEISNMSRIALALNLKKWYEKKSDLFTGLDDFDISKLDDDLTRILLAKMRSTVGAELETLLQLQFMADSLRQEYNDAVITLHNHNSSLLFQPNPSLLESVEAADYYQLHGQACLCYVETKLTDQHPNYGPLAQVAKVAAESYNSFAFMFNSEYKNGSTAVASGDDTLVPVVQQKGRLQEAIEARKQAAALYCICLIGDRLGVAKHNSLREQLVEQLFTDGSSLNRFPFTAHGFRLLELMADALQQSLEPAGYRRSRKSRRRSRRVDEPDYAALVRSAHETVLVENPELGDTSKQAPYFDYDQITVVVKDSDEEQLLSACGTAGFGNPIANGAYGMIIPVRVNGLNSVLKVATESVARDESYLAEFAKDYAGSAGYTHPRIVQVRGYTYFHKGRTLLPKVDIVFVATRNDIAAEKDSRQQRVTTRELVVIFVTENSKLFAYGLMKGETQSKDTLKDAEEVNVNSLNISLPLKEKLAAITINTEITPAEKKELLQALFAYKIVPAVIMERLDGDLTKEEVTALQTNYPLSAKLQFWEELADAFCYLTELSVAHLDQKPDNILFKYRGGNRQRIDGYIGDFGLAKNFHTSTALEGARGTYEYIAPEVFEKNFSDKSDVYSFAVMLVENFTGRSPYQELCATNGGMREQSLFTARQKVWLTDQLAAIPFAEFRNLLRRCLQRDPEQRPAMGEVRTILKRLRETQAELEARLVDAFRLREADGDSKIAEILPELEVLNYGVLREAGIDINDVLSKLAVVAASLERLRIDVIQLCGASELNERGREALMQILGKTAGLRQLRFDYTKVDRKLLMALTETLAQIPIMTSCVVEMRHCGLGNGAEIKSALCNLLQVHRSNWYGMVDLADNEVLDDTAFQKVIATLQQEHGVRVRVSSNVNPQGAERTRVENYEKILQQHIWLQAQGCDKAVTSATLQEAQDEMENVGSIDVLNEEISFGTQEVVNVLSALLQMVPIKAESRSDSGPALFQPSRSRGSLKNFMLLVSAACGALVANCGHQVLEKVAEARLTDDDDDASLDLEQLVMIPSVEAM